MNATAIARRVRRNALALGFTLWATPAVAATVSLTVVNVAGNLQLKTTALEAFPDNNPNLLSYVSDTQP
ncbi:ABC transporter substrate-binding protein, partial [Pseudomonas sp. MWU13-2625]